MHRISFMLSFMLNDQETQTFASAFRRILRSAGVRNARISMEMRALPESFMQYLCIAYDSFMPLRLPYLALFLLPKMKA